MIPEAFYPVAGFLAGSIPFSYLAGRLIGGRDVRREGSGNVGATNVFRVAGRAAGVAAVAGDVLKSLVPVLMARHAALPSSLQAATAAAVVLGHCHSPFLLFRGGKGVLAAVVVSAVLFWPASLAFAGVWVAVLLGTGYVSLASMTAVFGLPVMALLLRADGPVTILFLALALFVVFKHRQNIRRLLLGTEARMRRGRPG